MGKDEVLEMKQGFVKIRFLRSVSEKFPKEETEVEVLFGNSNDILPDNLTDEFGKNIKFAIEQIKKATR